jgi:hypothetical protein
MQMVEAGGICIGRRPAQSAARAKHEDSAREEFCEQAQGDFAFLAQSVADDIAALHQNFCSMTFYLRSAGEKRKPRLCYRLPLVSYLRILLARNNRSYAGVAALLAWIAAATPGATTAVIE